MMTNHSRPAQSMRREGSHFVKIAYCLIISHFRIEDYMSTTFRIASTSLPPIYVGVYLLSRDLGTNCQRQQRPTKSFYGVE